MQKEVHTLEEFDAEAARFARGLSPQEGKATLVTLSGELGAGKTALTKAVARALGVTEIVNSPTFVLEKIYSLPASSPFTKFVHIDAYRFEKGETLAPLHFDELLTESGTLIFLEWPEKVTDALPQPSVRVHIMVQVDGSRTISYAP